MQLNPEDHLDDTFCTLNSTFHELFRKPDPAPLVPAVIQSPVKIRKIR